MPSSACDWSSDVCSSDRSEEHTSELQSRSDLVCRLLLEKKKTQAGTPDRLTASLSPLTGSEQSGLITVGFYSAYWVEHRLHAIGGMCSIPPSSQFSHHHV